MSKFAQDVMEQKYSHTKPDGSKETWFDIVNRVVDAVCSEQSSTIKHRLKTLMFERKFIPGGRYLYASGRPYHQTQNCLLLQAEDSREGWANLMQKSSMGLMTGAGIGIDYSKVRPRGKIIKKTGGLSTGPIALMKMINEIGRETMQGGSRRCAIWAGLNWKHGDINEFITIKNWSDRVIEGKKEDFNFPGPLDMTNISVGLDEDFFDAIHDETHVLHTFANSVYRTCIKQMRRTGEPGFSVNEDKEILRNACTEITSEDDSDICNLGSINLANINSHVEMKEAVELGTLFLLCGTLYSDVPYSQVATIREKNRRLGLGLMGMHEWLLKRNKPYGQDKDLEGYLKIYQESGNFAADFANQWEISEPIKTRAIAPTGTIGIMAETTTGIEPIFCVAYKRRYLKGTVWHYQYVIDPTAKRLIEQNLATPSSIEDAYSIDAERRIAFQAWVQKFVDHGISSTINLPAWNTEGNNESNLIDFGDMLLKYLRKLRGITCYPDGARDGQPLTVVPYEEAINQIGEVFVEQADVCSITKGESCGD